MNDGNSTTRTGATTRLLQGITVLVMIGASLSMVTSLWQSLFGESLVGPMSVTLSPSGYTGALPEGAEIDSISAEVEPLAALGWRLTWWAMRSAPAGLVIAAMWTLHRLLSDVSGPFTDANVRRLGRLAGLATAYLFVSVISGPIQPIMQDSLGFETTSGSINFGLPALLALLCVTLADVWRRGVALKAEQDLTI